jgi:hypothetical protein
LSSRHQKGKRLKEEQAPHGLLIILCLLLLVGSHLSIIIIIIVGSTSETDAKSG